MRIEGIGRCAPRPAMQYDWQALAMPYTPPKRIERGSAFVEQTSAAMIFLEEHRDHFYKGLTDVGIWKLKRISEALGKVLAEAVGPPEPIDVRCDQCNTVVGKAE